ncbi:DUF6112 family protein [Trueperella pyogenes]|uniref:DUF6112 family protein n=1 Tax=Trueperella pyogenes TaxID=1661 RepID=UPI00345CC967
MLDVFMADPAIGIDFDAVPGLTVLRQLFGGAGALGLMLCVVALVIGGAVWAVGSISANPRAASGGKMAVIVALAAAFLIGGASALVEFFSGFGERI